jgi:hypothetical protein
MLCERVFYFLKTSIFVGFVDFVWRRRISYELRFKLSIFLICYFPTTTSIIWGYLLITLIHFLGLFLVIMIIMLSLRNLFSRSFFYFSVCYRTCSRFCFYGRSCVCLWLSVSCFFSTANIKWTGVGYSFGLYVSFCL